MVPMNLRKRSGMGQCCTGSASDCEGRAAALYGPRRLPQASDRRYDRRHPHDDPLARARSGCGSMRSPRWCSAMVLVGGATRLTESGLSITEWQPVIGRGAAAERNAQWQAEFEKYQAIPQYRELNRGMSLDAFKTIYLVGVDAPAARPADRRRRSACRSCGFSGAAGSSRRHCGRGCGSSSVLARCRARSAGGWSRPASRSASRSRNTGWRRISCSPALIYVALVWTALRLGGAIGSRALPGAHSRRRGRAARACAGADLSRRAGRRPARRLRLQHLAADRRRDRAGCGAAVSSTRRCGAISSRTR